MPIPSKSEWNALRKDYKKYKQREHRKMTGYIADEGLNIASSITDELTWLFTGVKPSRKKK